MNKKKTDTENVEIKQTSDDLESFIKKKKIQNSILKKLINKSEKELTTNKNNKS